MRFFAATLAVATFAVAPVSAATAQGLQLPPLNTPATGEQLPGKFVWFDMATPAIADQQSFYGNVFGWSFDAPVRTEDGYVLVKNQGRAIAGMFGYEPPDGEKDGATWIALMSVLDPDHAASIVTANGGSVEVAAATVAGRGRHALFRDPAGAIFGVLRSDSGDSFDEEVEVGGFIWVDLFARDIDAMTKFYSALAPFEVADRDITNEELFEGNIAVFVDPNGGVTGIVRYEYDGDPAP